MAGFFLSPWGRFFFVVIPRLPVSRQTRAGLVKKTTQRRLQKAALGAVSFAVILGLHILEKWCILVCGVQENGTAPFGVV